MMIKIFLLYFIAQFTSVTWSISALFNRASHKARSTVTFSKIDISCQSGVVIESFEMAMIVVGVEEVIVRSSHRLSTFESITNILLELRKIIQTFFFSLKEWVYLTCKRVNPERSDMRSSWRNGCISSGLSDSRASSNSSWWKSNNWKWSQKIRANNDI